MAQPPYDWQPTPVDVKALMPARLDGRPFDEDSIPKESEVEQVIKDVCAEIDAYIGGVELKEDEQDPETLDPDVSLARYAAKMGAAAEIERSFFPEQHDASDVSTYARYVARYRELKEQLRVRLAPGGGSPKTLRQTQVKGATRSEFDLVDQELLP